MCYIMILSEACGRKKINLKCFVDARWRLVTLQWFLSDVEILPRNAACRQWGDFEEDSSCTCA